MANNLLDIIKQNSTKASQPLATTTNETAKVADLLRAKSGRAVSSTGVGQTNLAEQSAVADANSTLQNQVAPAAELQNNQLQLQADEQQQSADLQKADVDQRRNIVQQQAQNKLGELMQSFGQQRQELDLKRDRAQVDQIMTTARLANKQYVDQLEEEGRKLRLDNAADFQNQLLDTTFENNSSLIKSKIGADNVLRSTDRQYQQRLSQITVDDIMAGAAQDIDVDNRAASQAQSNWLRGFNNKTSQANRAAKYQSASSILNTLGQAGVQLSAMESSKTGFYAKNKPTQADPIVGVDNLPDTSNMS
jgi:hypothetical protein